MFFNKRCFGWLNRFHFIFIFSWNEWIFHDKYWLNLQDMFINSLCKNEHGKACNWMSFPCESLSIYPNLWAPPVFTSQVLWGCLYWKVGWVSCWAFISRIKLRDGVAMNSTHPFSHLCCSDRCSITDVLFSLINDLKIPFGPQNIVCY